MEQDILQEKRCKGCMQVISRESRHYERRLFCSTSCRNIFYGQQSGKSLEERVPEQPRTCKYCASIIPRNSRAYGRKLFCNAKCMGAYHAPQYVRCRAFPPRFKGVGNELYVAVDLLAKDYSVYFAFGRKSRSDLIAEKDGRLFLIEVRTAVRNVDSGELTWPKFGRDQGKTYAIVAPDGEVIYQPALPTQED